MKKVILSLILATCTSMFCSLNAQEYKIPAKVVVITKQDVNIRKAPQTSAAVVEKASTGAMYELISQQGSWYEVKDIKTGNNVYVSATVGRLATGNQISRTDKGLVEKEESTDFIYQKQKKMQNGEQTTSYAFYQKQEKNIIYATVSQTTASMTGSMFTQEVYYKGKQMGWYLLFNETIDMDGAVQSQLEQPVIVFANGSQGVIINGESYKKVSNSF